MTKRNWDKEPMTEQEQADLALWRSFQSFKATLPDRSFSELTMRPTVYKVPVGISRHGFDVSLTVREVSSRRDLWVINEPDVQDCFAWNDRLGTFQDEVFIEQYDTTFDPAVFNRLDVIMGRLPQAMASIRKIRFIDGTPIGEPILVGRISHATSSATKSKGNKVTS